MCILRSQSFSTSKEYQFGWAINPVMAKTNQTTTEILNSSIKGCQAFKKAPRDAIIDQRRMSKWVERLYRLRYTIETPERSRGDRRLRTHRRTNFAKFHNSLVVPGGSSQELCAIVKISGPLQPEKASDQSTPKPVSAQLKNPAVNGVNEQGPLDKQTRMRSKNSTRE